MKSEIEFQYKDDPFYRSVSKQVNQELKKEAIIILLTGHYTWVPSSVYSAVSSYVEHCYSESYPYVSSD